MSNKIVFNPMGNPTTLLHDVNDVVNVATTDYVTGPLFIHDFRNQSKVTPGAPNDAVYRNFQPRPANVYGLPQHKTTNNAFTSTDNHGWFAPSFDSDISGVNLDKKWTWTP